MTDTLDDQLPKAMPGSSTSGNPRGHNSVHDVDKRLALLADLRKLGITRGEKRPVASLINGLLDERLSLAP